MTDANSTRAPRMALLASAITLAMVSTLIATLGIAQERAKADAPEAAATPEQIARGKYIVSTAGCHDCHTPWTMTENGPAPDMSRALSGHPADVAMPPAPKLDGAWVAAVSATNTAWSGPWGVSFTANLTPDDDTGLGQWTMRNFRETIRTGRRMGRGRAILPPMPIAVYNNLTDDDIDAVYHYLRSIPAVKNKVPEPLPPPAMPAS